MDLQRLRDYAKGVKREPDSESFPPGTAELLLEFLDSYNELQHQTFLFAFLLQGIEQVLLILDALASKKVAISAPTPIPESEKVINWVERMKARAASQGQETEKGKPDAETG